MSTNTSLYLLVLICILTVNTNTNTDTNAHPNINTTTKLLTHVPRVWCMRPQYMACQKYTLYIYCKGFTLQIIVVCGVFRYNISAESPAKSTLSQGHGLSTGGVSIYIYMYMYMYICICMYVYMYVCMHHIKCMNLLSTFFHDFGLHSRRKEAAADTEKREEAA